MNTENSNKNDVIAMALGSMSDDSILEFRELCKRLNLKQDQALECMFSGVSLDNQGSKRPPQGFKLRAV